MPTQKEVISTAEGASYMKYELVSKKGEKMVMPVRYSIRRSQKQDHSVSMDHSFHTTEALAGLVRKEDMMD